MKTHNLETLSERYLKSKTIAPATEKAYRIAFKHFIAFLKDKQVVIAKTSDVIAYRETMRSKGHSSHYIHIHVCALKGLYRYLKHHRTRLGLPESYAHDITAPIKNEPIKHRIRKPILTVDQAKRLIVHTQKTRKYLWHYRDHAIVYLMLTSGLRVVEIVHAKRKDFQVIDGKALLYVPKENAGPDEDFVKLSQGAEEALNEYLDKRQDDNPYLFISHRQTSNQGHLSRTFFQTMFPRVLKACGLDGLHITPHSLRHTAAMMNLLRGASIEQTKSLMRHSDIKSTLVYQEHIERIQDDSECQIEAFILKEDDEIYDVFICV